MSDSTYNPLDDVITLDELQALCASPRCHSCNHRAILHNTDDNSAECQVWLCSHSCTCTDLTPGLPKE